MAEDLNILTPEGRPRSETQGDVPERIRRRYLTQRRGGAGLGYYADARTHTATFRDQGHRLSTGRNDPHVVRDLVAIAQHRGWSAISVRGHTEFRREVWLAARAAGLEVRGYRPTERDRQQAEQRMDIPPRRATSLDVGTRLGVVEAVVRNRIVEPSEQARILSAARSRLAQWLERGNPASPPRERRR